MFDHAELTQEVKMQQLVQKTSQIASLLKEGKTAEQIKAARPGTTDDDIALGQWFLDNIDL